MNNWYVAHLRTKFLKICLYISQCDKVFCVVCDKSQLCCLQIFWKFAFTYLNVTKVIKYFFFPVADQAVEADDCVDPAGGSDPCCQRWRRGSGWRVGESQAHLHPIPTKRSLRQQPCCGGTVHAAISCAICTQTAASVSHASSLDHHGDVSAAIYGPGTELFSGGRGQPDLPQPGAAGSALWGRQIPGVRKPLWSCILYLNSVPFLSSKAYHPGGHYWDHYPGASSLSQVTATHFKMLMSFSDLTTWQFGRKISPSNGCQEETRASVAIVMTAPSWNIPVAVPEGLDNIPCFNPAKWCKMQIYVMFYENS